MSTQFARRKKSKQSKSRKRTAERPVPPVAEPIANPADRRLLALFERIGLPEDLRESDTWFRHLRRRRRPRPLKQLWRAGKTPSVWWGLRDTFLDHPALAEITARVHGPARESTLREASPWNAVVAFELASQHIDDDVARALRDLDRLQQSPKRIPRDMSSEDPSSWWQIIERSLAWIQAPGGQPPSSDWFQQLTHVEMPLTLAYLYPEFTGLADDVEDASMQFESFLATRLDPSGLPRPESWLDFRALLASWLRSARLLLGLKRNPHRQAWAQLSACLRQTLRAMRGDRNQMLLAPDVARGFRPMLRLAEELPLKRSTRQLVRAFQPGATKLPGKAANERRCECPDEGIPWILQSRWRTGAEKIAVWADAARMHLEIGAKQPLISGSFWPAITHDHRALSPIGVPQTNCWYADDDVQLLELQVNYEQGMQLDRLVLLAVHDRCALVADTLTGATNGALGYQLNLPLAAGVELDQETETREHYLRVGGKIQALAFPLAVPEWQAERTPHSFGAAELPSGQVLQLSQQHQATGLHAAVWFDLDPRRCIQPRTWRQLTVAKDLTVQPGDRAVAYRVRSGDEQWLLYRRVDPAMNCYSALGRHFNCELFFGKLDPNHTLRELAKIDWPAVE